jgi:hypothetical protein
MEKIYLTLYLSLFLGFYVPEVYLYLTTGKSTKINWTPFEINSAFRFFINQIWMGWVALALCLNAFGADFIHYSTVTMLKIQFEVRIYWIYTMI